MHDAPPSTGGAILRRTTRRHRVRLVGSSALFCVHQFCETMVPVAIGLIIGQAVETGDVTAMIVSLVGLAGLFVVLSYAYRIGARIIVVAIEREAHLLRVEVAGRVLDPRGVQVDLGPGELLTVSTSDAEKTSWALDAIARVAAEKGGLDVVAEGVERADQLATLRALDCAMVQGFQKNTPSNAVLAADSIMASVKHFALYGAVEGGRDYNIVDMSPMRMYNDYLPPYKAAIDAGSGGVMIALNTVNGQPRFCVNADAAAM